MKKLLIFILLVISTISVPEIIRAQDDHGYRFVRVRYDDVYRGYRGRSDRFSRGSRGRSRRGMWATDYPTADLNLHEAIKRTTKIPLVGQPLVLSFDEEQIYEYPVLYLTEPGYWLTNEEEVKNMQKYFARGGFMIIDDFHDFGGRKGREWYNFYYNIKQVFPNREPVTLDENHPIWSIYFDIDPIEARSTKPGFSRYDDEYYAIFDDNGRMMCVICYNQDIGDGWEWPASLADASTVSYQMAINFIIYALTH